MRTQRIVAAFLEEHEMEADPAYRLLDLAAEVGEVAGDAAASSEYGADPDALDVSDDELGDALFSLLALAESLDVDAESALEASLDKYERRIDAAGDASSEVETPGADADGQATAERTRYHKLVRDRIPEIVRENDQTPITRVADDEEYAELLGEKLVEEAREFRESGDVEELADVMAVVDAVREHRGVPEATLRDLQEEKAAERGRFEERIVLEAVLEP